MAIKKQEQQVRGQSTEKEWQNSVTIDMRNDLALTFRNAMFPLPHPLAVLDRRMDNTMAYAKKVEGDIYHQANSITEYFHLFAEKINNVQREIEERRQR